MALRDRLRRLEREARGDMVAIPQRDGTVRRFPKSALSVAFLEDFDRSLGRMDPDTPVHPLITAIANSDDPAWARSFVGDGEGSPKAVEDLSEGP
jgi:hypothetical protein